MHVAYDAWVLTCRVGHFLTALQVTAAVFLAVAAARALTTASLAPSCPLQGETEERAHAHRFREGRPRNDTGREGTWLL